jgi:hypothetical protein
VNWFGEFVVDPNGAVHWREGMRVTEGSLYDAFRQSTLVQFIVETSVTMGVRVGEA